jgi:hypothetical protein
MLETKCSKSVFAVFADATENGGKSTTILLMFGWNGSWMDT